MVTPPLCRIVTHPNNYPGKHLSSQPRTSDSFKALDPKAQFHLVNKGLGEYIRENINSGRGINYRGFGAFAFEVCTELVKPAQLSNFDITKELDDQREERMHNHKIRACFVPDKSLQEQLIRFPGKEEIEKPKSQHSIYQKGFNMIYCNPVPIANSCCLNKDVTDASLSAFAQAVKDLTSLGKTLDIKIGPIRIKINNRNLTYSYESNFATGLNFTPYEKQMKKSLKETKAHWDVPYNESWNKSGLSSMIEKPKVEEVSKNYENGLGLKIMSLDFNTTEKVIKNSKR